MSTELTTAERERIAVLADLLIPRTGEHRAASEADVAGSGIDRVLGVRPDLLDAVRGFLADLDGAAPATFAELYALGSPRFRGFADAVTAAYYLHPEVAKQVGYEKRSEIPIVFDTDLDALVTTVAARGPIYRPTPNP
jgi:hypothetical protein